MDPRQVHNLPTPPKTPQPGGARKGILSGLIRTLSLKARGGKDKGITSTRRPGDDIVWRRPFGDPVAEVPRRQKPSAASSAKPEQRSGSSTPKGSPPRTSPKLPPQPARRNSLKKASFNKPANGHVSRPVMTLVWPPKGTTEDTELSWRRATELVTRGAPSFRGHKRKIPNAADQFFALYTTILDVPGFGGNDMVSLDDSMTQLMTMKIQGSGYAISPWDTFEQPSYAFHYGRIPGTITFNQWACRGSVFPPCLALLDSGVSPRKMNLDQVMERLKELESGLEEYSESLLYKILYRRILYDPDKLTKPHKMLDRQITDLILVLSRPGWIDFTNPRNQVVTKFIFNRGRGGDNYANGGNDHEKSDAQYLKFMHQLLLGLELELRIHSKQHKAVMKEKLMHKLPLSIKWTLALARRWREFVRIETYGNTPNRVRLRYKLKRRQVRALRRFAETMKWPNEKSTMEKLKERDDDASLDCISSDAFAFFSGLVMPGPTLPFLIMNTLIDLDPDPATDSLALLSHMHPQCGFQYRNSYTYWSASCIVGKVLAPTCRAVAGWIGPGRPSADLRRSQIARIRTRKPKQTMSPDDVQCMDERSDALGPPAKSYLVGEYASATAGRSGYQYDVNTVRIELLSFTRIDGNGETAATAHIPGVFDATVQFAIDGKSWPLSLAYDVSFVAAWPCSRGPHPLFFDYAYENIKVDELIRVENWGNLYGNQGGEADDEKVLVVDARGVRDNEVLARAWCSYWGLSAVVANTSKTCNACAIREAYAGTLTVVILIDDSRYDNDDEQ